MNVPHTALVLTDLLERALEGGSVDAHDGGAFLAFRPFQLRTLRIVR